MEVYVLKPAENVSRDELERIGAKLSKERQKIMRAYTRTEDTLRSAAAGLLLQRLAAGKLGLPAGQIAFISDHHGKPVLSGTDGFHFNLSHSGEWVTAAFDRFPVGIDIERIRPIGLNIARDNFTASEYRYLMSRPDSEKESFFFSLWTLKESYLKMLGTGLSRPLDSFSISIAPGGSIDLYDPRRSDKVYLKQYHIDPRYRLSVCAPHDGFPETVSLIDWDILIQD